MSTVDEQLNPIAELRDELEYENIGLRIKAIRRLPTIARDLGEKLTRNELIPFLSQIEEGIVEVILAVKLFIPYIGGVEHAHVLFPPLEKLCTAEDSYISDQAVESLCSIGSQMRESDVVEHFIPLVMGLANRDLAMARVSACRLCPIACESVPEEFKHELVLIYHRLSLDDQPMVRRSAASNFGKFLAAVGVGLASQSGVILVIFSNFMKDGDESVRSLAMEGFASLGKLLMPNELDYLDRREGCVSYSIPFSYFDPFPISLQSIHHRRLVSILFLIDNRLVNLVSLSVFVLICKSQLERWKD